MRLGMLPGRKVHTGSCVLRVLKAGSLGEVLGEGLLMIINLREREKERGR